MGKRSDGIRALAVAGTSALLVVGAMADGTTVERSAVPAPVEAAITQLEAQGSTIGEVELETEDGKQLYSVELTKDGKKSEVEIGLDGKVTADDEDDDHDGEDKDGDNDEGEEVAVDAANVPAAVKSAVEPHAKGAAIDKYTKETDDGAVAYEAEFKVDGKKCSVKVAEDGTVVEVEKPADALPASVTDAIKKKYPAATIKKSEAVQVNFFEVKVENNGKTHEVKVDATGNIMGSEEEHED